MHFWKEKRFWEKVALRLKMGGPVNESEGKKVSTGGQP
jgi:hypothetical protein